MNHDSVVIFFIVVNSIIFLWTLRGKLAFVKSSKQELEHVVRRLSSIELNERGTNKIKEQIDSSFKSSKQLKTYWDFFSASLVSTDAISTEPIYSSSESSDTFNIENLLTDSDSFVSFSIWNAVPQVLTSTGIIGTFFSILVSLLNIRKGNIDETFIKTLVDSLASGFISSLAGIGLAVVFIVIEKVQTKEINTYLAKINRILSSAFPKLGAESILISQGHTLSNLSVDIQTAITNGFTQMTGGLGTALADVMDDDTKKTIKEGVAASFIEMNKILLEIRNESKELHSEISDLKSSKEEMFANIKILNEEQKKLQAEINNQNANLVENLNAFEKTIAPLTEVAKQVQGTNELSDKLIQSVKNISEISTQMSQSINKTEELSVSKLQKIEQLTSTISKEYQGLGSNVETWVKESNTHLESNLKEFDRSIGQVLNQVVTISNSFNTGVISLERTVTKLTSKENN